MSANGSTAMDFAAAWPGASTGDVPGAASVATGTGTVRGMNRSTATTTIATTSSPTTMRVELAGRLCCDRGVALHLVLALQTLRGELVDPGKDEREREAEREQPEDEA